MSRHPLDPAFAKIDRAETHIKELGTKLREFFRADPYRIEAKLNRKGDRDIWSIVPEPIPDEIESIANDAVHNLRTPLDKMLTAGFRHDGVHVRRATVGSIGFPTGDSQKSFERALSAQKENLAQPIIEFLETTQPYLGGRGALLWAVNKLDNRDKHRAHLTPVRLGLVTADIGTFGVTNGRLLSVGSRRGQHMIPTPEARPGQWDLYHPIADKRPVLRTPNLVLAKPGRLEFRSAYNDMEVMTTTPGTKVHADMKPVLNVSFSEVRSFESEPAYDLLEAIREEVKATLMSFRKRFF